MRPSETERVVIGNAELWHGDCRDVLPLVQADACVSDPPPAGEQAALFINQHGDADHAP